MTLSVFVLSGCGGSSNTTPPVTSGTTLQESYRAVLPDGTPMILNLGRTSDDTVEGTFAMDALTGMYGHQAGSFAGKVEDGRLVGVCGMADGDSFGLSGSIGDGSTLSLTRSDLAGTQLSFKPVSVEKTRGLFRVVLRSGTGVYLIDVTKRINGNTGYVGEWEGAVTPGGTGRIVVFSDGKNTAVLNFYNQTRLVFDFPKFVYGDGAVITAASTGGSASFYCEPLRKMLTCGVTASITR